MARMAIRQNASPRFASSIKSRFGICLPEPGQANIGAEVNVFWINPDVWMFDADISAFEDLMGTVKSTVKENASVVDQTDNWCRFDLCRAFSHQVLERLCRLNSGTMKKNMTCGTLVEHTHCFIWCLQTKTEFAILAPRSYAQSIHEALMAAANSVTEPSVY